MDVVVGLDSGTTATKAVTAGTDGRVRDLVSVGYPLSVPAPGRAELDARRLADAAVEALAAVCAAARDRGDRVVVSGDLIDSAQRNELEQFLTTLTGGRVEPDSGGPGYRGVQQASNPDGHFYRPGVDAPRHPGLLSRAQRPFVSTGLRVPWWPAVGNHDLLVQGELPPSPATEAIATGSEAAHTFDPALEGLLGEGDSRNEPTAGRGSAIDSPDLRAIPRDALENLLARGVPGRTTTVPADQERAHLEPSATVAQLRDAARVGGGGDRLNYGVDVSPALRLVVLDTVDRGGGAAGVITKTELTWLGSQLASAGDRAVIVISHHGLHRARRGAAAIALLDDDPRVVAELHGDTHRHEIRPVRTSAGGYWRIGTASLADWPQQGRMLRVLAGDDGSRAIETWTVDHAGELHGDDLAGVARRLAHLDAQGGRPQGFAATPRDRNARLWLPPAGR